MNGQTGFAAALKQTLIAILLAIGGFASIATVLGFFGGLWWLFDLLANFRWQLMWAALVAAILYALTARGIATIIFLVAVAINAFVIAPLWLGDSPAGTGEDGVRVVTLDMYGGVDDREFTLRWLFESEADLIIVSGVTRGRIDPLIVDGSPYVMLAYPAENTTGIVVVGRDDYSVAESRTETFDQPVLAISVPTGSTTIDVVTSWGPLATNAEKAEELEERLSLLSEVVSTRSSRVAVVGNLGATRWTTGMRSLMGDNDLRDATEGLGYLSTWPVSDFPVIGGWIGLPIDVVLMSDDVTPLFLETGPDVGAGHLPVTVVIGPSA